jgi:hypothetical protein
MHDGQSTSCVSVRLRTAAGYHAHAPNPRAPDSRRPKVAGVRMLALARQPVTTSRARRNRTAWPGSGRKWSAARRVRIAPFWSRPRKGMREPYTSAITPPERRHVGAELCPLRLHGPLMQSTTLANISLAISFTVRPRPQSSRARPDGALVVPGLDTGADRSPPRSPPLDVRVGNPIRSRCRSSGVRMRRHNSRRSCRSLRCSKRIVLQSRVMRNCA